MPLGSPDKAGAWTCTEGPPGGPVISAVERRPGGLTMLRLRDVMRIVGLLGVPSPRSVVVCGCVHVSALRVDGVAAASRNWRGYEVA